MPDTIFVSSIQSVLLLFEMMQSGWMTAVCWFGILQSFNLKSLWVSSAWGLVLQNKVSIQSVAIIYTVDNAIDHFID